MWLFISVALLLYGVLSVLMTYTQNTDADLRSLSRTAQKVEFLGDLLFHTIAGVQVVGVSVHYRPCTVLGGGGRGAPSWLLAAAWAIFHLEPRVGWATRGGEGEQ